MNTRLPNVKVIDVDYEGFRAFLEAEQRKRNIGSVREFAKFLGVSHSTIGYYMHPILEKDRVPGLDVIERIAERLGMPLTAVLSIAFPRLRSTLSITELSADEYRLIEAYRGGDTPGVLMILSDKLRKAFRDNPALAKDE